MTQQDMVGALGQPDVCKDSTSAAGFRNWFWFYTADDRTKIFNFVLWNNDPKLALVKQVVFVRDGEIESQVDGMLESANRRPPSPPVEPCHPAHHRRSK